MLTPRAQLGPWNPCLGHERPSLWRLGCRTLSTPAQPQHGGRGCRARALHCNGACLRISVLQRGCAWLARPCGQTYRQHDLGCASGQRPPALGAAPSDCGACTEGACLTSSLVRSGRQCAVHGAGHRQLPQSVPGGGAALAVRGPAAGSTHPRCAGHGCRCDCARHWPAVRWSPAEPGCASLPGTPGWDETACTWRAELGRHQPAQLSLRQRV